MSFALLSGPYTAHSHKQEENSLILQGLPS